MKIFSRLSWMTKAVLISGLVHILILTVLFWPHPDEDGELQIVDLSSGPLEMDVAPPEPATDEAIPPDETAAESDTPLPAPPPTPRRQETDTTDHSVQNTLSMAKPTRPADMTPPNIPRRNIKAPVLIQAVNPRYPESKLKDLPAFQLTLVIQIMETGEPGFVAIQKSSGIKELDEAAVTAVKQWKFAPAFDLTDGRAVPYFIALDLKYPAPNDSEGSRQPTAP